MEKHPKVLALNNSKDLTATQQSVSPRNFELQLNVEHENLQKRMKNYQINMLKRQKKKGRNVESELIKIKSKMTSESLERLLKQEKPLKKLKPDSIREKRLSAIHASLDLDIS